MTKKKITRLDLEDPKNETQAGLFNAIKQLASVPTYTVTPITHIEESLVDLDNPASAEMLNTLPPRTSVNTTWLSRQGQHMIGKYTKN